MSTNMSGLTEVTTDTTDHISSPYQLNKQVKQLGEFISTK